MIDVNVTLSQWPFRRLPDDGPEALARRLRRLGVKEAWAGSFDALLHHDLAAVNARLAALCRSHGDGLFRPFGAVDPMLPDWRDDLRRCHEEHQMPGVRLHPDYHGYTCDDPKFLALLDEARSRKLIVQIALKMQDARTLHPLLKNLRPPAVAPLVKAAHSRRCPPLVLLNALGNLRGAVLKQWLETPGAFVDVAMLEGAMGVERFIARFGHDRLLFGSHAPLFQAEAAHLKLKESTLTAEQAAAIDETNARRLIERLGHAEGPGKPERPQSPERQGPR